MFRVLSEMMGGMNGQNVGGGLRKTERVVQDSFVAGGERLGKRFTPGASDAGLCVLLAVVFSVAGPALAGDRKFAYSYQATTSAVGEVEYEQWVTWKTHKEADSDFDRFDFRHEIELGLTERLMMGIYLADWRYQDGKSVSNDRAEYRDTAVELIYNLSNPATDPIGLALYGEVKLGDELFELEGKIIAQKDIGPWTLVYNITIAAEWEGNEYADDKGEFKQSAGVSYQVSPKFLVGVEFLHEIEFDDWEHTGESVVYFGPNMSYRAEKWFITLAPLVQMTNVDAEADFQTRMIFGLHF